MDIDITIDNIEQLQHQLCCHILIKYSGGGFLREIYEANTRNKENITDPLELIRRLASSRTKPVKPDSMDEIDFQETCELINLYRSLNDLAHLNNEYEELSKIRQPDAYVRNQLKMIRENMDRIIIDAVKSKYQSVLIPDTYPQQISSAAWNHMLSDSEPTAQEYVDALRRGDYIKFSELVSTYLPRKYDRLYAPHPIEDDDVVELILHELSRTDMNQNDLRQVYLFGEMLLSNDLSNDLNIVKIGFAITNLQSLHYLFAARQITQNAFQPDLDIKTKDDLAAFKIRKAEQDRLFDSPDSRFAEKSSQIMNALTGRDKEGEQKMVTVTNPDGKKRVVAEYDLEIDKFRKENIPHYFSSVIIYLLRNVPLERIENKLGQYVPYSLKAKLHQSLLDFQFKNMQLVREWQMQLKYGGAITRLAHEKQQRLLAALPNNYEEYLKMLPELARQRGHKNEHELLPLIDKGKFAAKAAVRIDEKARNVEREYFENTILPRLKRETAAIALKEAKKNFRAERDVITKELIHGLQAQIENTEWKVIRVFGIGGKEIEYRKNGELHRKIVPENVYNIYQMCLAARKTVDIHNLFMTIQQIGAKASTSGSFFRHAQTQQFYDKFRTDADEKAVRKGKPPGHSHGGLRPHLATQRSHLRQSTARCANLYCDIRLRMQINLPAVPAGDAIASGD